MSKKYIANNYIVLSGTSSDFLKGDGTLDNGTIGYVTPEQYGALGNGINDDATAIQNAINSGKPVIIGSKTYLVNSTIVISAITSVQGFGNKSIIKTTSNLPVFDLQSDSIKIDNIQISGSGRASIINYDTTFPLQNGIKINGFFFDINISKVYFNNLGNAGIYGFDNTTTGNFAIKNGINVNNCEFRNNLIGVFWDTEFEFNFISNCYFRDNEWGIKNGAGNNAVIGGQVIRNRRGIEIAAGLNNAHSFVNGTHINQNFDYGVIVDGITFGHIFANCIIMYNSIYLNNSIGVTFDGGEFSLQYGLTVTNCTNPTFQNINFLTTPTITQSGNTRLKYFNNTFVATRPSTMDESIDNISVNNIAKVSGNLIVNGATSLIGVGTTNPRISAGFSNITLEGTAGGSVHFRGSGSTELGGIYGSDANGVVIRTSQLTVPISLAINDATKFRISTSGNTLINTIVESGNNEKLQVSGNALITGTLNSGVLTSVNHIINGNAGGSTSYLQLKNNSTNIAIFGSEAGIIGGLSGDIATYIYNGADYSIMTLNVKRITVKGNGRILMGTADNGVDKLQVSGSVVSTQYNISALNTAPATSGSTGTLGEIRITSGAIYVCTATNTWVRANLTSF